MKSALKGSLPLLLACAVGLTDDGRAAAIKGEVKLITLDPGHFHAALFQREMLAGVSEKVQVYAPLGPDVMAHLNRVAQFNLRKDKPTHWRLEVHTGPDFLQRMLAERRGNIVVVSGKNSVKIDRLEAMVRAGLHVLADKPWIIELGALPKLESTLDIADKKSVIAYDAMTERFEISGVIQRELVNDRKIFGGLLKGSVDEPAVCMESVHYLLKEVAGVPNLRPAWFFDVGEQGEGLTDVGTHLVERAQWMLFPDQAIDQRRDVEVLRGSRWPTMLTRGQFQRVTGEREFPDSLKSAMKGEQLEYFCNNSVQYTLRGIHVKLEVKWDFEAAPGVTDSQWVGFRGTKSRVEVRQGQVEKFRPEVTVMPNRADDCAGIFSALKKRIELLQKIYPGLAAEEQGGQFHVVIPDVYRIGHEAHFAMVTRRFLEYVRNPELLPAWEKPNMLAKYYVTTKGIELARRASNSNPKP